MSQHIKYTLPLQRLLQLSLYQETDHLKNSPQISTRIFIYHPSYLYCELCFFLPVYRITCFLTCVSTGGSACRWRRDPECGTASTGLPGLSQRLPPANGINKHHLKVEAQSWTVSHRRLTAEKRITRTSAL